MKASFHSVFIPEASHGRTFTKFGLLLCLERGYDQMRIGSGVRLIAGRMSSFFITWGMAVVPARAPVVNQA